MDKISKDEKKTIKNKFREFERNGLEAYSKYLHDQLEYAKKSENRLKYQKYIENQMLRTDAKIEKLSEKLK
jgi:hypothetical protein